MNAAILRKLQRVPLKGEESVPLEGEGCTLRYRGKVGKGCVCVGGGWEHWEGRGRPSKRGILNQF